MGLLHGNEVRMHFSQKQTNAHNLATLRNEWKLGQKLDNQVQTLSCRRPFWLKSIRVSFLCKSWHLFERSINTGSHFLFLKGECQGHVLRAYIIVFIREFTTNSNKNIQFGVFALWKTTKEHIYWKDSKDIDGLENELQWTTSRPAVHYLNIHPLNNT